VKFAGVSESRLAEIEKAAKLTTPEPYAVKSVNDTLRNVEDYYRHNGFNNAEIEVQPEVAPDDTVALTFNVVEGTQQVLQSVQLAGNEITHDKVLTQALHFTLGDPVDLDEWALARKRLYDTNVFRLVDIQPIATGDAANGVQPVKATVSVEEIPAWTFRYGFQLEGDRERGLNGLSGTQSLGVVSELRNPNLFGRALTGGIFGMYRRDQRDASVFLATSRLFGWRARSSLYGFYTRDRLRNSDTGEIDAVTDQQGVSVDQRWKPKGFQVVYGYRFERNHTYDPEPPVNDPLPFDVVANLAKLSTAVLMDRRDDPISSRKGTFSSFSFDNAAPFLGSDVKNRKLLMQEYVFVPVSKLVLASRAQVGFAFGRDPLAFEDRFRAGGATSVRGYGEESLGPRDAQGLPAGGDRLLILNQEARFPIRSFSKSFGINGVTFIDGGNVYAKGEDWSALKFGYGFGLRVETPVGLLRGDVGFPLSRTTISGLGTRFYFGFGHIF
jgi:outer membrane protein insertion porin family